MSFLLRKNHTVLLIFPALSRQPISLLCLRQSSLENACFYFLQSPSSHSLLNSPTDFYLVKLLWSKAVLLNLVVSPPLSCLWTVWYNRALPLPWYTSFHWLSEHWTGFPCTPLVCYILTLLSCFFSLDLLRLDHWCLDSSLFPFLIFPVSWL